MELLNEIFSQFNAVLWGPPLILLLLGTHLWMTVRTRGVQRWVFKGIKLSVTPDKTEGDISPFAALTTALASTIGTGNIIGVATAIVSGGPGAVLWTWLTGLFGIATKYAESLIAVKYRRKTEDGTYLGGAMVVLEKIGHPKLGVAFALLTGLAAFGIGCSVQSSAIADALDTYFHCNALLVGLVLAAVTFLVIFGGVKSIANVCEKLVPFMSLFYTLGCFYILYYNRAYLLPAIELILQAAFTPRAMAGGFIGSTIMTACRYGCARGLFSNESGMGSADRRRRSPVAQSGPSGIDLLDRHVLGHCRRLPDHRPGARFQHPRQPGDLHDRPGGRRTDNAVLRADSRHRHAAVDLRHPDVRLLDDSGMELLWRTMHGVFIW